MHNVWNSLVSGKRTPTVLPALNFDEIVSSLFSAGPMYFYLVDFCDFSLSDISNGFMEAHGVEPSKAKHINDILDLVHPDDLPFVIRAEKKAIQILYSPENAGKITRYKTSYNFRFRSANGDYKLYNHQALVLTVDDKGNFVKSLNIHTDISHLSAKNNMKLSMIGLEGEPSFLMLDIPAAEEVKVDVGPDNTFSRREVEIIRLLAAGLDTKSMAGKLCISEETVKTHRKNINRKSGCRNVTELVARSVSEGWV